MKPALPTASDVGADTTPPFRRRIALPIAAEKVAIRGAVLRTGFISTLHPWEGAAERLGALQSDLFDVNNLRFPERSRALCVDTQNRGPNDTDYL